MEQTPWANPQHPAHQRNHLMTSSHHSRHDTLSEHQPVLSEQQSGTLLVPKTHPTLGTKVKPSVNSKSAQATSLAAEVDADSVRRASPTVAREQVATKGAKKTNKSYASGSPVPRSFNAATSKSVHDTRVNNQAVGMNGRLPPSKQSIIQVSLATDVTLPSTSFGTPQVAMAPDYSNGDMTVPAMCETGPDATPHSGHLNPSAGKAATIAIGM